jgi:site-specific DNA recombinase
MQGSAVVYVRESDPRALDTTYAPEVQRRECAEMAASLGFRIVDTLYEGWTGVELFERPVLTDLRRRIAKKEIDAVFFAALDRIARDPVYQQIVISECLHFGVSVYCVHDDLDHSDAGRLIQYVKGYAAKQEWAAIRRRTQGGRRARVADGKPLPGPRPMYGYQWVDPEPGKKTRLVPDPVTAPIVQRIFRQAARGHAVFAIANDLSQDRIPTPTGKASWRDASVRDILRRPHYAGKPVGWVRRDLYRANKYNEAPEAIALDAAAFPALVDEQEWTTANERINERRLTNRRMSTRDQTALLVGGMIRCGYCGRRMYTRYWRDRYQNYVCNGEHGIRGTCEMPTIAVRKMDSALWQKIAAFMSQPELIVTELERYRTEDPTIEDLAMIDRRHKEITRQQTNLTRRLATIDDDTIAALVMNELKALREQEARLDAERERLAARRDQWESGQAHIEALEAWCRTVSRNLDSLTYEEQRTLLAALNVRVTVWKTDHDPRFVIEASVPLEPINTSTHGASRRRYTC